MKDPSHQLDIVFGGSSTPTTLVKTSRAKSKQRPPPTPAQELPLKEKRFLPVAGVPKTRGDCPDTSKAPCPFVRCRYHLWRIDACDRAGRPGLGSVPRDEHGHTISVPGKAGEKRSGTTLWPAWLELERTCKVVLARDDAGRVCASDTYTTLHTMTFRRVAEDGEELREERHIGTWEMFREHTHDGEAIEVYNEDGGLCGAAELMPDGIWFRALVGHPYIVVLRRVRGVPSCALDEADKGRRTNTQIGDAMGRHRTLIARGVDGAVVKVKERGVSVEDLVGLMGG